MELAIDEVDPSQLDQPLLETRDVCLDSFMAEREWKGRIRLLAPRRFTPPTWIQLMSTECLLTISLEHSKNFPNSDGSFQSEPDFLTR
jgi:hypothetical protein